jgi:flagellar biosynthesis/type III secretory pathway protein FliH
MTYDPNADRTYWRGQEDTRLIEAARDSGHELAIALGERLDDAIAEAQTAARNAGGWGRSPDALLATIAAMRAEIEALEAQVANLLYKGD